MFPECCKQHLNEHDFFIRIDGVGSGCALLIVTISFGPLFLDFLDPALIITIRIWLNGLKILRFSLPLDIFLKVKFKLKEKVFQQKYLYNSIHCPCVESNSR